MVKFQVRFSSPIVTREVVTVDQRGLQNLLNQEILIHNITTLIVDEDGHPE